MALISKPNTFSSGATIVASEHNSNYDTVYDAVNGNLNNANIVAGAGIVGSKLDLSSPGTIGGSTASPGTFTTLTSTGDTTLGNASGDDVTITGSIASSIPLKDETVDIGTTSIGLNDLHFGSGGIINFDGGDITLTHSANTLTLAGATTFDFGNANMTNVDIDSGTIDGVTIGASSAPTVTDLGSVATCDINGGTIDGTNIGVTSAGTIKGTTIEGTTSLKLATGATITGIVDEDNMSSNSATLVPTQQSVKAYADSVGGIILDSTSTFTDASTVTITIADNNQYLLIVDAEVTTASGQFVIRFDGSSNSVYDGWYRSLDQDSTPSESFVGASSATSISIGPSITTTNHFYLKSFISTQGRQAVGAWIKGDLFVVPSSSGILTDIEFSGHTSEATTTSVTIVSLGSNRITGSYYLYKYALS